MLRKILSFALVSVLLVSTACSGGNSNTSEEASNNEVVLNIATVNNPDMRIMEEMSSEFEKMHPNIKVKFTSLPDNELRQKVTVDVSNNSGHYDIATIGPYEIQSSWANNNWLVPLNDLFAEYPEIEDTYNLDDVIESILDTVTVDGKHYGLPFYGESNMLYYRKDLFEEKGLEMPKQPTWTQVEEFAKEVHDPENDIYGIVLNGIPQYGQISPLLTVINAFGARWFDEDWEPQLTSPEFKKAVKFYTDLLKNYGQPGPTNIGFNEGLGLMAQGRAAMWNHATVAASMLDDPDNSEVKGKIGYAFAPIEETANGSHWLYTWALGILSSSKNQEEAFKFITWATSQDYINLVAEKKGWSSVPPGTRISTHENENYLEVAPWAEITLESIKTADINNPTKDPVPYNESALINIPEYSAFASDFAQNVAAILTDGMTVDETLEDAQEKTKQIMKDAGYYE